MMQMIHDGQCGMCAHFGEHQGQQPQQQLIQIRTSHKAPEDMIEECGHPQHHSLHLMVTPISGCQGFEPAKLN